ncbi:amino acid adenylation domain-containing protein [Pseudoalteromonas sp. JBTF-M23]|uniref:Amino acid adenylation domain-containing protein n=1 Tax=Pseudoalteromonas caenipelagi TaxID=2726988 RepID=A0A849VCG0_9GAMM|nr:non-ribosomal peptide synthetase [Pseudoalteromonas caenipelagi]NOU50976.1 amino acid adenylation domain-containing protein [Pseudoalteromonas caenipelagi]
MAKTLLQECWKKGIKLSEVNGNLSFKAEEGVMTPQLIERLKANKPQLLSLLKAQPDYYDARALSANERALWFLYRMRPHSVAYNMAYTIELKELYTTEQVNTAFAKLCDIHPVLALNYGEREGEPVQWLTDFKPAQAQFYEFKNISKTQLHCWLEQQADTLLAPDQHKTCHIALAHNHVLATNSKTQCFLSITIHHIAADFISFDIIRRDFIRLLGGKKTAQRVYPNHSYQKWSERQANALNQADKQFWLDSLTSITALNLPTDFAHQANMDSAGKELHNNMSQAFTSQLKTFCRNHNITPYIWWLAAFEWFMARLSGQTQFVIGTPSAGRLAPEDAEIVGYTVNPLALNCQIDPSERFSQFLARVKQQSTDALKHQEYPFAKLVDQLTIDRDSQRSPVFQHMFTLNSAPDDLWVNEQIKQQLMAEQRGAAHELNLVVVDHSETFTCKWRFNNSLYKQQTVETFQAMFTFWVEQLLRDATTPYRELLSCPPSLEAKLSAAKSNACSHSAWQAFATQVEMHPQHTALREQEKEYSYAQLNELVKRACIQLTNHGFGQGDRLGITLQRSCTQVIAMLASWQLGGSFLVLDIDWPKARIDYIVQDANLKLLVGNELYAELGTQVNFLSGEQLTSIATSQNKPLTLEQISVQDEAYLIYTSGSTGQPKAVQLTHGNLVHYVDALAQTIPLSQTASMTSLSKHSADLGYTALFGALLTGREYRVLNEQLALDSQALLAELKRHPVDCLKIVPSHFYGLLQAEADVALLPLHTLIFGGEALTSQVIEAVKRYAPQVAIYNHYGPTEATIGALVHKVCDPSANTIQPIGVPLPNYDIKVIDACGQIQAQGLPGELHIGGPALASGYLNQRQLTAEKFYEQQGLRWYRSGDNVVIKNGLVYFLGRNDEQIKIRGYRVELGEVEAVLKQYCAQAVVIADQNDDSQTQLLAYVAADEQQLNELKTTLSQRLPSYMVPTQWHSVEQLPRLANGKIDRKSLAQDAAQRSTKTALTAHQPATALSAEHLLIETQLLEIWQSLLNSPHISVEDDFFSVGGDSILGLQVIAQARKKDINIKPQQLFEYKTIRKLAEHLVQANIPKAQQILLAIVRELLNNQNIQAHDDFFAVGGDSILSLQLVAKARKEGIQLLPKDIFTHKTIAQLIAHLPLVNQPATVQTNEKTPLSEQPFPLTPIQHWFFEQPLTNPHYWNQSVVLNIHSDLDFAALQQACAQVLKTHAALRMSFNNQDGTWQQQYNPYQQTWLSNVVQQTEQAACEDTFKTYQSQFNLSDAPLVRFVHFKADNVLLCTAHHLVVDAVSWQVIIDDLQTSYSAASQGKPSALPDVHCEFAQWQRYLSELANDSAIQAQQAYWQSQLTPSPIFDEPVDNLYQDAQTMVTSLDSTMTAQLLNNANFAYNTNTQELLLCALTRTLTSHWQLPELTIELEGHGREANLLAQHEEQDVSRTVAWFTTRFAQKFSVTNCLERDIIATKEQLRFIPNKGIGYGLLRYMQAQNSALVTGYSNLVSFNFLGSRNSDIKALFSLETGLVPATRDPKNRRAHLLDINILVQNQQLHIHWSYPKFHSAFSNMNSVTHAFHDNLAAIIAHCLDSNNGRVTGADFTLANIDDQAFIRLLNELAIPSNRSTQPTQH